MNDVTKIYKCKTDSRRFGYWRSRPVFFSVLLPCWRVAASSYISVAYRFWVEALAKKNMVQPKQFQENGSVEVSR